MPTTSANGADAYISSHEVRTRSVVDRGSTRRPSRSTPSIARNPDHLTWQQGLYPSILWVWKQQSPSRTTSSSRQMHSPWTWAFRAASSTPQRSPNTWWRTEARTSPLSWHVQSESIEDDPGHRSYLEHSTRRGAGQRPASHQQDRPTAGFRRERDAARDARWELLGGAGRPHSAECSWYESTLDWSWCWTCRAKALCLERRLRRLHAPLRLIPTTHELLNLTNQRVLPCQRWSRASRQRWKPKTRRNPCLHPGPVWAGRSRSHEAWRHERRR